MSGYDSVNRNVSCRVQKVVGTVYILLYVQYVDSAYMYYHYYVYGTVSGI